MRTQHAADIAAILDSLPADDRLRVLRRLDATQAGAALVEASEAVRASLAADWRSRCITTWRSER